MVGQSLGHYQILEKLGAGGMGEVYRAEDTTLKRQVALKVLPAELADSQERLDRFEREAKTLATLDHPNIVTIFSVEHDEDVHFLTMQLVGGKRLSELIPKGGMPLERIFEIAIPLADALAAAHEKGVIHRDLKPGNIMVSDDVRVKVLDFGLAKLRPGIDAPEATALPTEPLTEEGLIVGTIPYMSPEQLEGKDLDPRSDIFSLGVVLYEMTTGERPFKGDSSASLIMSIGRDTPPEVDRVREELPHHLGRVIAHCLEKNPKRRYQSALDVNNELTALRREVDSGVVRPSSADSPIALPPRRFRWWPFVAGAAVVLVALGALWLRQQTLSEPLPESPAEPGTTAEAQRPMIVVLPFENLGDPEDEYFADGMTEEITSRLAVVSGLRVISRTSAMQYKENRPSLKQVGEELGVDYVLEGSVRWAPSNDSQGRVRITPQLIRVADDSHLWADSYDRVIEDIFRVQTEIAENVVAELGIKLLDTESQALAVEITDDTAAYQAYLRGLEIWRQYGRSYSQMTEGAGSLFEKAVQIDPSFARAWAWLSTTRAFGYWTSGVASDLLTGAKVALDRAMEIAPSDPYVRLAKGHYLYYGLQDFDRALQEFQAIEADLPNDAQVIAATGFIFRRQGRLEDSIAVCDRALALDPRNVGWLIEISHTYRGLRRFPEASRRLAQSIDVAPTNAWIYETWAIQRMDSGDINGARKVLKEAPVTDPMHLAWGWLEAYDRNFEAALEHANLVPREGLQDRSNAVILRTETLLHLNRSEEARKDLQALVSEMESLIAAGPQRIFGDLALAYAYLGRREAAIREAQRMIELTAGDLWEGPSARENLAWIHVMFREAEAAIEIFEHLLTTPYEDAITVERLRLDPRADPLRDHPRFQALLEKYGQEAR